MMKTLSLLILSFILFFSHSLSAQVELCGSTLTLEYEKKQDPKLEQRINDIETFIARKITESKTSRASDKIITIPVVFHILHNNYNPKDNISQAQINSQLRVLNEDFRRNNKDKNNKWPQAADTKIEFCLAQVDPNGNPTSGVTRRPTKRYSWNLRKESMKNPSKGGVEAWDTNKYLNIWVVNLMFLYGDVIAGHAHFPGSVNKKRDGIVISHWALGTNGTAEAPKNKGRTLTHEVGHYLGLKHIWGLDGCDQTDLVSDTPNANTANFGNPRSAFSCGSEDMSENFMDYTDDIHMNLFTQGQKTRMRSLFKRGGFRYQLGQSNKCERTGRRANLEFEDDESKISLYPNPTKGPNLFINTKNQNMSYTIVNMLGQKVSQSSNFDNYQIDVKDLKSGIYIIQFETNDAIIIKRFIKE